MKRWCFIIYIPDFGVRINLRSIFAHVEGIALDYVGNAEISIKDLNPIE